MHADCATCDGWGYIADPNRGWMFWRRVKCEKCGGDGRAKMPGWPDPVEMKRLREIVYRSPPPPPPKVRCCNGQCKKP